LLSRVIFLCTLYTLVPYLPVTFAWRPMYSVLRGICVLGRVQTASLRSVVLPASSTALPFVQKRLLHNVAPQKVNGLHHLNFNIHPTVQSPIFQNHWFKEARSLPEIHKFLDHLSARNVYNIILGSPMTKQIRGIRVCPNNRRRSNPALILLSGHQASEWTGVAVGLYLASNFALRPLNDVDVYVIPTVNPVQYDLFHQSKSTLPFITTPFFCINPMNLMNAPEADVLSTAPLKSFIKRVGKHFIRIEHDLETGLMRHVSQDQELLANTNSTLQINPLVKPFTNCPPLGALGEICMMGPQPSYIIELRDKDKTLTEDQIVSRGEEILTEVHHLFGERSSL